MSIDELIAEGEAIKDSIDLRHKMGKLEEYHIWRQKVIRFLNQEVPGDIVIHNFEVAVKGFNFNYCSKESGVSGFDIEGSGCKTRAFDGVSVGEKR